MRVKIAPILVLFALVHWAEAHACSQCLCGTPFPADALGGVVPMELRYGLEERYLSKSNALEDGPGTELEREHRISAFALWRATNRLALLGRLPYNVKEIQETPAGEATTTETGKGLGDLEVNALIGLSHSAGAHPTVLGLVLGAAVPTGSNDKQDASGERLDAHAQPGSGAWSGTAGANISIGMGAGIVDGSVLGRANGTSDHGYRYGNVLLFNAGYMSESVHGVRFLAHLNGRSARQDRLEDGTMGEHTGGTVVYLSPGARWQTGIGLDLEAAVQIPVVESLYGIQDEHTTGRLALSLSH